MEERPRTRIEISDEGVIFIDFLTADYAALDEVIMNDSVYVIVSSKEGYDKMLKGYKDYLYHNHSVKDNHSKIDYINYLYDLQVEQAREAIGSSLKVIRAASRILGISEKELYKQNVEQLKHM